MLEGNKEAPRLLGGSPPGRWDWKGSTGLIRRAYLIRLIVLSSGGSREPSKPFEQNYAMGNSPLGTSPWLGCAGWAGEQRPWKKCYLRRQLPSPQRNSRFVKQISKL